MTNKPITPPTPLARQFVRLVVGFSVGVGVGVAPFLGTVDVPLLKQLVDLFPDEDRNRLFVLGAFLMGVVAVAVQFYAAERLSRQQLRRLFARILVVILLALALLAVLTQKFVTQVDITDGVASFLLVGERLPYPQCPCKDISNYRCLRLLGADPEAIADCWSRDRAENVALTLTGSYLLLTGGFGALIGLLLLQLAAKQQEAARRRIKQEAADRRARAADAPEGRSAKKKASRRTAATPAAKPSLKGTARSKRPPKPAPEATEDED